jgi:hypothetical protein
MSCTSARDERDLILANDSRTVHDRGDRYENGEPLLRPGHCWRPVIHRGDARPAPAKERTGPGKGLIARGLSKTLI